MLVVMEPTITGSPAADYQGKQVKAGTAALLFAVVTGVPVSGLWLIPALAPGELIAPVSPDLFAAAVCVGVLGGLLLTARVPRWSAMGPGHRRTARQR